MTSVLLVDDEGPIRRALKRALNEYGYNATEVEGYDQAVKCLKEKSFDVLLTDLRMAGQDGLKLIELTHKSWPDTRPILMSAYASALDSQRAVDLGAIQVLCKPFTNEQLVTAVRQAVDCSEGFVGTVHGLSLIDILQMFHYGQRSVTVHVLGIHSGSVSLDKGQVISAEFADLTGEEALGAILSQPTGALRTMPLEPGPSNISRAFQPLLLDHLRKLDEREREGRALNRSAAAGQLRLTNPAPATDLESLRPSGSAGLSDSGMDLSDARAALDLGCAKLVSSIVGGMGCALVELSNGSLLGVSEMNQYAERAGNVLATATRELFRGAAVIQIEKLVRQHRGLEESDEHYIQEIQLTTTSTLHFSKALAGGRVAIMLVTSRNTNVAMGWVQLRRMIPSLEAELHQFGLLE